MLGWLGMVETEPAEHATMFGLQDRLLDSWRGERAAARDAVEPEREAGGQPG